MIFRRVLGGTPRAASPEMRARLIGGPIIRTMLSLSLAPTTAALAVAFLSNWRKCTYVGLLGIKLLAALTLVAPVVLLMQLLSAADVGGAISAAMARARGANETKDLQRLVLYAVVCSLFLGLLVATIVVFWRRSLNRFLGGKDRVLDEAISYGRIVFGGAVFMWMTNLLAATLRGRGETFAPSVIIIVYLLGAFPLYPDAGVGALGRRGLGLVGALADRFCCRLCGSATIASPFYMQRMGKGHSNHSRESLVVLENDPRDRSRGVSVIDPDNLLGRSNLGATDPRRPTWRCRDCRLRHRVLSRSPVICLLYGLGRSTLGMVGANLGAGNAERSYRVAVVGTLMATAICGALGLWVALRPDVWLVDFSDDPAGAPGGRALSTHVGPAYALGGAGSALLFVGQAKGQMRWTFWGTVGRFAIVAVCATGLFGFPAEYAP